MHSSANTLGISIDRDQYRCRTCKREVDLATADKEGWYYRFKDHRRIPGPGPRMQYVDSSELEYVCNEHYQTLNAEEAGKFVALGYPYLDSLMLDDTTCLNF
ncbi:MAG TPA: hypothetical protein VKS21_08915 [Spirochaetota bacterium]|nr:hypothetical protein [Spirochaetota bacterium]